MKNKLIYLVFGCITALTIISSCKKDEAVELSDQDLYNMAKSTSGFVYYNNSDALLNKSDGSGHEQPLLRVKYNSIAASVLNVHGKLDAGTVFPDGSLIVKELYDNPTALAIYAILYKKTGHKNADAKGWVCSYVEASGNVLEPSVNKGQMCSTCHSQANNVDNNLMPVFFP